MYQLTPIIAMVYAGHFEDSTNVAVLGLAQTCTNVLIFSIMIGINSAQETLTSQAFGAENLRLCGIYLNRGSCILTACFIALAMIPSLLAERIFLAIG